MKRLLSIIPLLVFLLPFGNSNAQKFDNVTWSYSVNQKGCEAELVFTATIEEGWYIYSQFQPNADGPIPTSFVFTETKEYNRIGKVSEGKSKAKFMEGFGGEYNIFQHKAVFKQKIKVLSKNDFELKGEIEFMQCDESKCLPPQYPPFSFKIKGCAEGENVEVTPEDTSSASEVISPDTSNDSGTLAPVGVKIYSRKYSANDYEVFVKFQPDSGWTVNTGNASFTLRLPEGISANGGLIKTKDILSQKLTVNSQDSVTLAGCKIAVNFSAQNGKKNAALKEKLEENVNLNDAEEIENADANLSYWAIFLEAFLWGFVALLTPCVFPMIPMTVSFFMKSSKNRKRGIINAITYGVAIIVIYVFVGLLITWASGDATALNKMSTSIFFNLLFFIVLMVFAISFLGAFEIVLPSKWVNAADKNADRGGLIGIFFMAFTLALVSFSCTGPIIGTLLVRSVSEGLMGPAIGMFGFSLAIAIPFTLFAVFPGWLNSMPQSGGWLNTVKVSLGFLELALALKFLSKADLVNQSHLLERELFLALFIGVFFLWGLYLLGVFMTSHDSENKRLGTGRILTATLVFGFVIYLIPGLWGAPLNWIAGFPPPIEYSEWRHDINKDRELPEHASYGPHGLVTFHDYYHGMEYARKTGKPAMIDFTGYGCENCRKMEQGAWSYAEAMKILEDSVVIISLHVDERTPLAANDPDKGKFRNVGQKWADMEVRLYKESSQPLYVLLDHNEESLNGKASFQTHSNGEDFHQWLSKGLRTFKKRKGIKVLHPEMVISNEISGNVTGETLGNIPVYTDFDAGINFAKTKNKPVLLYFTAYADVNSRKFENEVIIKDYIREYILEELVFIKLYVDDRASFSDESPYAKNYTSRGKKWSELEKEICNEIIQPLFVVITSEKKTLNNPSGYHDVSKDESFYYWMKEGVDKFKMS
ncbi:MAG: thioredoxin family protein [Bacteroidota bacterium]